MGKTNRKMNKIISDKVEENDNCEHVFILFEDGEVLMTKGGSCFLQRSLFDTKVQLISGKAPNELQELFDKKHSGYHCSFFQDDDDLRIEEYRMLLSSTLNLNYTKD